MDALTTETSTMETPTKPKSKRTYRERKHHISKLPVRDILKIKMAEKGFTNIYMQKALGLGAPNYIAMMRTGTSALPPKHAIKVADLLGLDKPSFFMKALEESDAEMADHVKELMFGERPGTDAEKALVDAIKKNLHGFDLTEALVEKLLIAMSGKIAEFVNSERAKVDATVECIDRSTPEKEATLS